MNEDGNEIAECPDCGGYGLVAKVVNWETQPFPCLRCNETGEVLVTSLTRRERKTWRQRERRRKRREQAESVGI